MWKAYANGELFFYDKHPNNIAQVKLDLEIGTAGSFSFVVYPEHPMYNSFAKLTTLIIVKQNDIIRFRGRVLTSEDSFRLERTITAEGDLAFLNDSIQVPFGDDYSQYSPRELITSVIVQHNATVDAMRQFTLGNITIPNPDSLSKYSYMEYRNSMEAIENLASVYGGAFIVRHEDGINYLDWLDGMTADNGQAIVFGKNLIDMKKAVSGEEIYTGIIPIGEINEDTGYPTNITEINDGNNYLINNELYQIYGKILKVVQYDGYPADFIEKARADVAALTGLSASIDLTAVDLSALDSNIEAFSIGKRVRVISAPHGIDTIFDTCKMSLDLLNPGAGSVSLGKVVPNFIEKITKGQKVVDLIVAKPAPMPKMITLSAGAYSVSVNGRGTIMSADIPLVLSVQGIYGLTSVDWISVPSGLIIADPANADMYHRLLDVSEMGVDSVIITARVVYLGATYEQSITIVKQYAVSPTEYHGVLNQPPTASLDGENLIAGDSFLYFKDEGAATGFENGQVYEYQGPSISPAWLPITAESDRYSEVMGKALGDALALPIAANVVCATNVYASNLAAYNAFLASLVVKNLKVGSGTGATGSGFRFRAFETNTEGEYTPIFDVYWGNKCVFKIVPETGQVFLGSPEWDAVNSIWKVDRGFQYDPGSGAIKSKGDKFQIADDGHLIAGGIEVESGDISASTLSIAGTSMFMLSRTGTTDVDTSPSIYEYEAGVSTSDPAFDSAIINLTLHDLADNLQGSIVTGIASISSGRGTDFSLGSTTFIVNGESITVSVVFNVDFTGKKWISVESNSDIPTEWDVTILGFKYGTT